MRADLKSGAWIEHLPVSDLKARHKDIMSGTVRMELPPGDTGEASDDPAVRRARAVAELRLRDARWAVLITAWSFELPVPEWDDDTFTVTARESVGEIPAGDYDDIEEILTPHSLVLLRRPDPKGATTSSSNGSSPARARASRTASPTRDTATSSS